MKLTKYDLFTVSDQVRNQIMDKVSDQVINELPDQINDPVWDAIYETYI